MSAAPQLVTAGSTRPIRVLHMGSPTGLYGAERWILALIKHLPPDHVESWVGVIKDAPGLQAPLCKIAAELGFRTQVFESYGRLSRSAVGQLRRFLLENEIDILHTHFYKTDIIGRLAAWGTSCKTVATPHGWSVGAGLGLQVYEMLDRLCYPFMDAVVPLSQDLYTGLKRIPGLKRKLHLIENGVDLSELDAPNEVPELVGRWRRDGRFVIGYIGQLITRKRIDTLIEAFHQLEIPNKQLCLIGDGPQRPELEVLAARLGVPGSIVFLGFRDDRMAFLKGFDLFVLPSELEGIPRCLMEAMALGVPVIASDIPGCRELIIHGETGLLSSVGDARDLHHKIQGVIKDRNLRLRIADKGRESIRNRYSATVLAQTYHSLYQGLMEGMSFRHGSRVLV